MSTSSPDKRPLPLGEHVLRLLIRVATERGYYTESLHKTNDHPERNISPDDVIHGLERDDWKLCKPPDWDVEHQNWEYLIGTVDIEGDELTVKVGAYPDEKRIRIITAW